MKHEAQIEKAFIGILTEQEKQWTYREDIKSEKALWDNLRRHINRKNIAQLDGIPLTDSEFTQVKNEFRRETQTPFLASQWLRGENGIAKIVIEREDNAKGRVTLILFSNKDINGGISSYEVVNQIVPITDGATKRGDVTLLINGLPAIHIELKSEYAKDGYSQAFDQIERYAQSGFFDGIFATVQIMVVSNKVSTKYFARPSSNSNFKSAKKFLFNWREDNNKPVENLFDFTRNVLSIPMAHELISRFTILVDDKKDQKYMMVLRPYQIHAIKKIQKQASAHEGGFIWHATGSGKTITSFVATKLLAQSAIGVARTVMIVDRKDLDSQTKGEFSKFASEYNTGQTTKTEKVKGGKKKPKENALIVGIDNKTELVNNLLSRENNNTIIVTTIQKLSRAIRECKELEKNKFEKLKGEHIVFIVDECHRAVSDKEMKNIKKFFPMSTWFGFTGTPIFKENRKQESGKYARTTQDQYGIGKDGNPLPNNGLLHAYTTKNAMDDKSVLDFQVEYHSLLGEEDELALYLTKTTQDELDKMDDLQKEALLAREDYENEGYIKAMLKKIFKHHNVIEKFKVKNGIPTMSAILTTHSIPQAKRIYSILMELKQNGELITGKINEARRLNDPGFPRVAITYSLSEKQGDKNKAAEELLEIMREYDATFNTHYAESAKKGRKKFKAGIDDDEQVIDDSNYNQNINNRLARKGVQYQKDGQWLDFVIVVERLLTGFDAPTIQTLYVDKELTWHGLLQAFSRTNRVMTGKNIGMIVTFRKPHTMAKNVQDAIRLFSNEERDWESLIPKQYKKVRQDLKNANKSYTQAKQELEKDPNDLKKKINTIRTFQAVKRLSEAIESYEEFENDFDKLKPILEIISNDFGNIENLKSEVREAIEDLIGDPPDDILEIEFSADQRATLEETIDSYYISQLLKDIRNEESKRKFDEILKDKPTIVQIVYKYIMRDIENDDEAAQRAAFYFKIAIESEIGEAAANLRVPKEDLQTSFNEYNKDKGDVPYLNTLIEKSGLTKEIFEQVFPGERFRRKIVVIGDYWKNVMDKKLMPLKNELAVHSNGVNDDE
ncbi:MAG: HsdR family type I site-specific deoxyribonuclease [Defluviitaleaceae bacterium]|nr:HsdR family type I site-specific deoxyribonuclease [Defluviitaleaceae bacterium]